MSEFSMRELLRLEKESSGMYFSGHIIDSFKRHIDSIKPDYISDIIEQTADEEVRADKKYFDKSVVRIAGLITAKRTKLTKNGDVMAYLTVEDRYSEINVIVFAKSYTKFASILDEEEPVVITGTISTEEGEAPRILLSSAEPLIADTDYVEKKAEEETRLFIKVPVLTDIRINKLKRIIALNRGNAKVILYDESTGKYSAIKDLMINPEGHVLDRIASIFGEKNVILK
jgi:DNA polymerase-3 subunit alpha